MDSIIQQIDQIDKDFIIYLMKSHHVYTDFVMHWLSDKVIWIPLYMFIIFKFFKAYPQPQNYIHIVLLILSVVAANSISSDFAKPYFERLRPCHDEEISALLDLSHCGGKYGFFSSHAANVFALATYVFLAIRPLGKWLIPWAILVSFSRIYLCVHYPSDVTMGAVTGVLLGVLFYKISSIIFNKIKNG